MTAERIEMKEFFDRHGFKFLPFGSSHSADVLCPCKGNISSPDRYVLSRSCNKTVTLISSTETESLYYEYVAYSYLELYRNGEDWRLEMWHSVLDEWDSTCAESHKVDLSLVGFFFCFFCTYIPQNFISKC